MRACVRNALVCGSWACGRPTFGCCSFGRPTFGCLPSGSPACCLLEASAFRGAGGSNFLGFFIKPPHGSSPLASPCVITPSSYCCPSAAKGLPGSLDSKPRTLNTNHNHRERRTQSSFCRDSVGPARKPLRVCCSSCLSCSYISKLWRWQM